ncbi:GNAT family N-acetyltransferase [Streptomyces purpurascens]|uniref:GNAT family N-acetyltransferase n=1 Tax=Streptomyces purpurascens TaxID=1924 RepID=UPI0033DEA05B
MTSEQHTVATDLRVGGQDDDLETRLDEELTAFNTAAADGAVTEPLTVRATDETGELIGGLTAWTWGSLCSVDMLWVREDQRHAGWGGRLMRAAEAEAARRGCTDMIALPGARLLPTARLPGTGPHPGRTRRTRGRLLPQAAQRGRGVRRHAAARSPPRRLTPHDHQQHRYR